MSNTNQNTSTLEKALILSLAIIPLGVLTIKGWPGYLIGVAFLLALMIIFMNFRQQFKIKLNFWEKLVSITLLSPIIGVFISQLIRQDWIIRTYDSPSRFLMALPIFWVVYQRKLLPIDWWKITLPCSLISLPFITPLLPQTGWAMIPGRFATYFVDPLTFGRIALSFGCLSFLFMAFSPPKHWLIKTVQFLGGIAGVYYSIKSGSRTGWLAIPILTFIFIFLLTSRRKLQSTLIATLITMMGLFIAYQASETIKQRTSETIQDIATYSFGTLSPSNDSSIGLRLSFAQMGWHYFTQSPFTGYDDKGFEAIMLSPQAQPFHSDFAKQFALTAGFHNELITNSVRAGIWGTIYTLLLLLTPLILAIAIIKKDNKSFIGLVGLTFSINEIVASLSTEVFNLKFTAALYALIIACILAQSINQLGSQNESE
jgi:O-antigen ligase